MAWVRRKLYIRRLPLPTDCLYEIDQYLTWRPNYELNHSLIVELMEMCDYSNHLRHYNMLVFCSYTSNLVLQSVFCDICGNFVMFNGGVMEGRIMCTC
jgi:hypothetical protein